ncbi:uncharacterized protein LOC111309488 [Durio zibethinus]|uniref:Uncharacterized protein LOC111309488 n=1 Tax=Durio zibethinus TaxID=66656 RepID=A0A6P6AHB2_DURZI|nr:uncharacterized protein LOC111309488 [Durio zibethinus]
MESVSTYPCLNNLRPCQPNFDLLPDDVISKISNQFTSFEDVTALSGVCRPWRSACFNMRCTQSFFSFDRNKLYELKLPQAYGKRCHGSPHGWIVTMDSDLQVHLLHPISQAQLNLPKLNTIRNPIGMPVAADPFRFIHKCILLKPSEDEFLVMVIFGPRHCLAFAKPGFVQWKTVVGVNDVQDLALFKGQIYAICGRGRVRRFESDDPESATKIIACYPPDDIVRVDKIYLLESSGELLAVFRNGSSNLFEKRCKTKSFLVYMLQFDVNGDAEIWKRLNDIGDYALFVGEGNSWSIQSAKIPNCNSNRIYFTDDNWEQHGVHDIGVFYMVNQRIESLEFGSDSTRYHSRPIWFTPTLRFSQKSEHLRQL